MKKLSMAILCLILLSFVTGCKNSENANPENASPASSESQVAENNIRPTSESSNDEFKPNFNIKPTIGFDGNSYEQPLVVGDLLELFTKIDGYVTMNFEGKAIPIYDSANPTQVADIPAKEAVSNNQTLIIRLSEKDKFYKVDIQFENHTDAPLPVTECRITRLELYYTGNNHENNVNAAFSMSDEFVLDGKYTVEEAINLLGEPDYDGEYNRNVRMENGNLLSYTFIFSEDNVLSGMRLGIIYKD